MTAAGGLRTRWRAVDPHAIDSGLAMLWREAAVNGPVSRAAMTNLVVVNQHADTAEPTPLDDQADVVQVAKRHPARIIQLHHPPGMHGLRGPATANIGVLTFGGASAEYGVEVIAVSIPSAEPSISSIVRSLARGDVPTTVWWTDDLSQETPPESLVRTARQFIYDSSGWRDAQAGIRAAAAIVNTGHTPDVADLNWRRLTPLRQSILHALESEPAARTLTARNVIVRYRPGGASAAWLLAGWLRCRLKWEGPDSMPRVEESEPGDELVQITLTGSGWTVGGTMSAQRVRITSGTGTPPFTMPVPKESVADAVVAELRTLGRDSCLREAILSIAGTAT